MMQIATDYFPNQVVEYEFKNRTKLIILKNFIDEKRLVSEINHVKTLSFKKEEIEYLRTQNTFSEKLLSYLSIVKLDNIDIDYSGREIGITCKGKWCDVILWETLILSIVNELYCESKINNESYLLKTNSNTQMRMAELFGLRQLYSKISELVFRPDMKFMDFGTRRRFSRSWHENVIEILSKNLDKSQFIGTSNVYLAMKYGLTPLGTNAHELYMFASGYFDEWTDQSLIDSQCKIWDLWWNTYGEKLSICLTDTFGTDAFFEHFGADRARKWKGFRHDSGDPFVFGDKLIKYLKDNGIDPMTKTIVFSDGLDINMMLRLFIYFSGKINIVFGIGTNLTNDVGLKTLSIVMKMTKVWVNGEERKLVKLSDNTNKITGDETAASRYKRAFKYNNTQNSTLNS